MFLSVASLVEIEAAIERIRGRHAKRADALHAWFDGLVTTFGDRIHPVDVKVGVRAGKLLPYCQAGHARHRVHDSVLVATAQVHGHGLLTKRDAVFGAWTRLEVTPP